jgi:hypothetical protein
MVYYMQMNRGGSILLVFIPGAAFLYVNSYEAGALRYEMGTATKGAEFSK